jgi:glycosyltransferase involved in cell wall biosynthesis
MTSKKRTIFIDAHVLNGIPQGTVTYLKGLYRALHLSGEFELIFGVEEREQASKELAITDAKLVEYRSSNKYYRLAVDIPLLIRKYKCDFSHFQYIVPLVKNARQIVTIHDVLFLDFPELFPRSYYLKNKFLFNFAAESSDLICTVSDYSKNMIQKHFHIPENKMHLTPNATFTSFDTKSTIQLKLKHGVNKLILFVSRIEPRKNHVQLMKAFIDLKLYEKDYSLVFIGSRAIQYPEFDHLLSAVTPDIRSKIILLENLSDEELGCFYKEADLFVFPSFAEGFGIPPLEAAINHTRVLCSNSTAMEEFSFFKNHDLSFNPENLNELKEKISRVLMDEAYPFTAIKEEIKSKYDWNAIALNFTRKIHEIC